MAGSSWCGWCGQLALDLSYAMAMDYSGKGCEEAERLMNRRRELGACGKKVHMQKKYRKVKNGNVAKSQKTMEALVGNSCAEALS